MEPSQRHASIVPSSKQYANPAAPVVHVHWNDVRGTHELSEVESVTPVVHPPLGPSTRAARRAAPSRAAEAKRNEGLRVFTPRT